MISTLDLLGLTPDEGLRAIIQTSLNPGFKAKYLEYGTPVALNGVRTSISLNINKSTVPVKYWKYGGVVDFQYDRLDLSEIFGDLGTVVRVQLPATYDQIVEALGEMYGIVFTAADYEPGTLEYGEDDVITLRATPASLRWVGSVQLIVKPKIRNLTEVIEKKALSQLSYLETAIVSVESRLVDEINTLNANALYEAFKVEEVIFSEPAMLSEDDVPGNTKVEMTTTRNDLYKGQVELTYQRQYFPRLVNYYSVDISNANCQTTVELARLVADKIGIYLDESDIVETGLPMIETGEQATVTVYFKSSSLMYTGEMTVEWTKE
jgi:hypothetical protein